MMDVKSKIATAQAATAKKEIAAEAELDYLYATAFSTSSGSAVLENLKRHFMSVVPPGTPESQIVHHEGGRFIIKHIIDRANKGKKNG